MVSADKQSQSPHPVLEEYYACADQRRRRVDAMFDASAPHYDWINGMMSLGSGRRYRSQALERAALAPGMQLLDVGAGTGVVSLIAQQMVGAGGLVIAHDPSRGMLQQARNSGVANAVQGLGEKLPYADDCFDRVTMAYALRHVADLKALFAEFARVLKPGGQLLVMEITRPENVVAKAVLRLYMRVIVPTITRVIRGSAEAQELMRYYWDTIEHCVPPAAIIDAMSAAGLAESQRRVELGIFSEYSAGKS